jgi:predicted nucleic acid-binding protein
VTVIVQLDASVLINHDRTKRSGQTFVERLQEVGCLFSISSVAKAEVMVGIKSERLPFWKPVFDVIETIPFTEQMAERTRVIGQALRQQSKLIEIMDIMIAASAMECGVPLATANRKHFEQIEGLTVITP